MEFNYDVFQLNDQSKKELRAKLELHRRYSALYFRVLDHDDKSITIRVRQGSSFHENQFDANALSRITKETFSPYSGGKAIHARAVVHRPSDVDVVTPEWIKSQMQKHKVKNKDLVQAFGIGKADISAYANGHKPLSQFGKSAFYYYFLNKE